MRPRVFIGSASSPERMEIARAIGNRLHVEFNVIAKLWNFVFPPSEWVMESLLRTANEMDFAVFVLGPDDLVVKRRPRLPWAREFQSQERPGLPATM